MSSTGGQWVARAVVLIALLLAVVYLRALNNPILESDRAVLIETPQLRGPGPALELFVSYPQVSAAGEQLYTPVSDLSLATDRMLWGPSPRAWRITSLVLHGLSSLLLFLLLMRTGLSGTVSVLGALLFALHPIHTQAINVVSSRGHILSGALTLSAVLLFARGLEAERPGWKRNTVPGHAWWSLGVFLLALFSGPEALAFPLVCLIWPWVEGRRYPQWHFYLGLVFVFSLYVVMSIAAGVPFDLSRVLWGGAALVEGLRLIVAPVGLMVIHPLEMVWSWADGRFLAGLAVAVVFALVAVLTRGKRPSIPLYLSFLSCALLGSLPALARGRSLDEPGLYLATAAACGLAAAVLDSLGRTRALRQALMIVLAVCVAAAGFGSSARCAVWKDAERVWLEVLRVHPQDMGAKEELAAHYRRSGHSEKAAALVSPDESDEYSRAMQINNEGVALMDGGRLHEAAAKFEEALSMWPWFRDAQFNLGVIYQSLGQPDSAEAHFTKALEIDPSYASAHYNLGIVYDSIGDLDRAEAEYRDAVRLDPSDARALANLGALKGKTGRFDEAISFLEQALEVEPGLLQARFNLALAYEEVDIERAREQWRVYLDLARARGVDPARLAQVERRMRDL